MMIITITITFTDGHVAVHWRGSSKCPRSPNGCLASSTGGDPDNHDDQDVGNDDDHDGDHNSKVTGLSPDTAYTVVMETSLGLGISHQVDIITEGLRGGGDDYDLYMGVMIVIVVWKIISPPPQSLMRGVRLAREVSAASPLVGVHTHITQTLKYSLTKILHKNTLMNW